MNERYKDFPPGWNHVMVPQASKRAALAALSIYTASRPRSLAMQRVASWAVSMLGPRVLPGRSFTWRPPVDEATWDAMRSDWERRVGHFDVLAFSSRRQSSRSGFSALLLNGGDNVAFVKVEPDEIAKLAAEFRSQRQVFDAKPRSFRVPEPLIVDEVGGWSYLAMEALPPRIHAPAMDASLDEIVADISAAVDLGPRPDDVEAHWTPMHGDLTPWNLRVSGDETFLIDWEQVAWGPPGADEALFLISRSALNGRPISRPLGEEALAFWREQIIARPVSGGKDRLRADLLHALDRSPVL